MKLKEKLMKWLGYSHPMDRIHRFVQITMQHDCMLMNLDREQRGLPPIPFTVCQCELCIKKKSPNVSKRISRT